ncbi:MULTISPECIES: carbohydrate ABC transporter permease [Paenibacillus]|jgi:arabinosaccharide transport system permease protein|uniref:Binding-protein-dependent transport systems inner membrane component n=2 Tax=Paenibacillus lactis TaxID=228574 RepID=G4HDR5_9BACL|nr:MULTISPECIES: ABC transporter permease subunit [Paenibacillus]EHB64984.1 binding-protein-dependent transport systems inner membrane component [Paenibacillus lactis 154]MBP1896445.1 arabinosaccharide transport system permease protein [Paenibacillus lactis]MCM3497447.1 sugar ABC transporter permease [Paenibacillus lactis]GIO90667.1 L-arabinose transport system permease protein AraP [Paenibacillus lactis]HAF99734.1 sugar ABC transporter permease [Paenibacillus lactis]
MIKKFLYSQKVAPYVFVLPFILVFLVFWVYPLGSSLGMSFQKIQLGQEASWIGLDNYEKLAGDGVFLKAVTNSAIYMVLTLLILIPFPMLFAVLINSKLMWGREFFKSSFFFPALTSVVVAGTIFRLMFGEMEGSLINSILGWFGIDPVKFLKGQVTGFIALLALATWRWTGVNMLYFLSGLKNIPDEYYEAASIDGASSFQKFTKITMPLLKPTTIYVLTISIYAGLAMFIESMMLWNGNNSPKNIGLTIVGYLYRQGIEKNNLGYAAAVGIVLLAITMIINLTQLKLSGMFKKED